MRVVVLEVNLTVFLRSFVRPHPMRFLLLGLNT